MTEFPERGSSNPRQMGKIKQYIDSRPGASETAELVALGVEAVTDWNVLYPGSLTYKTGAVERDWLTLDEDGNVVLSEDAGGVVVSLRVRGVLDYSETTVPADELGLYISASLTRNGAGIPDLNAATRAISDGVSETFILDPSSALGTFVVGGTLGLALNGSDDEGSVLDGTFTADVTVNITRQAPAPTFPEGVWP